MDINFKNGSTLTASNILEAKKILDKFEPQFVPLAHPSHDDITKMLEFYGINADKIIQCPECNMMSPIRFLITHLNDSKFSHTYSSIHSLDENPTGWNVSSRIQSYENHALTFKQIGKWLEGLGY